MAKKARIEISNGLVPVSAFKFSITNVVPPRPKQHAMLLNPLGFNPSKSRVVAAMGVAGQRAKGTHNG